ncbi:LysM peptidoglycan-binding domain-containing protein [Myxococcota bacterium]|nr:LysM peptidoglycan-binding domain-containing protein [Myxococcota bacterium]
MKAWLPLVALTMLGAVTLPAIGQDSLKREYYIPEDPLEDYDPMEDEVVVKQGDTLWDLSGRVLGKPWLWPRVWAVNPEISNPHWIYPGDVVRFHQMDHELPLLADLISRDMVLPEDARKAIAAGKKDKSLIETIDTSPRNRKKRNSEWNRLSTLFVTAEEMQEAGTLTNAAKEGILLSVNDDIYISMPPGSKIAKGQRLMLFRTVGAITHPVSEEEYGLLTQITGFIKVRSVIDGVAIARIEKALLEIERGQYVAQIPENLISYVKPVAAKNKVDGVILGAEYEELVVAATDQLVFIDKGKSAGVLRGNVFGVYMPGDPLVEESDREEFELIAKPRLKAKLIVLDVKDDASTCLVTAARQEIESGDHVRTLRVLEL